MVFGIIKSILSMAEFIMYWVPLIHVKVVLPVVSAADPSSFETKTYSYGILRALSSAGLDVLAVIGMMAAFVSIVFSLLSVVSKTDRFNRPSSIIFFVSLAVFAVLFVVALIARSNY